MIQAVTRIQAGFRSKQTRDILKQYKTSLAADFTESSDDSEEEEDSGHFWTKINKKNTKKYCTKT